MKAVILAGGRGTRLAEETHIKPKPLVEAGGRPLIWHIMKNYSLHGVNEFIVLAGYRGVQLKEYFSNYWLHQSDVTFDLSTSKRNILKFESLPWKVTVIDTGVDTNTGSRILKARDMLSETFLLTYGDGVANVNVTRLIEIHKASRNLATLTAVQPPARFGALNLDKDSVVSFQEKPRGDGAWVNGGYFVVENQIFDYMSTKDSSFEIDVLPKVALQGKLGYYKHDGFWQPVDTIRDLQRLEEAIDRKTLPWI